MADAPALPNSIEVEIRGRDGAVLRTVGVSYADTVSEADARRALGLAVDGALRDIAREDIARG